LSALIEKGLVKINNFRRANNKLAYAYLLTPSGIEEKALITVSFLQRKMREYGELQEEIEALRREVSTANGSEPLGPGAASTQQAALGDAK
jgi:EPS-associated MarR family transcriptional regulator